ncbi:MAG: HAMP domain-containing histidine kinase [Oscillospiraceae bacterium]|nr:HAMP domain-containing histidine kinase [Oscillospiraceae bacterium]
MRDTWIKQLFELQRDATIGVQDGVVVFANPAAVSVFPHALPGISAAELLPEDVLSQEQAAFTASTTVAGRPCTVLGRRVGDIAVYTVILKEAPGEAEGRLLENLCHTMRRKLTVLNMATEVLNTADHQLEDPRQQEGLTVVNKTTYQLRRLCDNLDHLIRLGEGQGLRLEEVDLVLFCGDLIQSTAHFAEQMGHKLHFRAEVERLVMAIDPQKVTKLLLNLLSNSLGRLEEAGCVQVTLTGTKEDALLTLTDSGTGIAPERMAGVFAEHQQPFDYTDPQAGAGLGMAVCEKIAHLHGGTLLLTSQADTGTTVFLRLPIRRAPVGGALLDNQLPYGVDDGGMHMILMELSDVLGDAAFGMEYRD